MRRVLPSILPSSQGFPRKTNHFSVFFHVLINFMGVWEDSSSIPRARNSHGNQYREGLRARARKHTSSHTPIIFLTIQKSVKNRKEGLEIVWEDGRIAL